MKMKYEFGELIDPMIITFASTCLTGVVVSTISRIAFLLRELRKKTPEDSLVRMKQPNLIPASQIFEKDRLGLPLSHLERRFLNSYRTAYFPPSRIEEQLSLSARDSHRIASNRSQRLKLHTDNLTSPEAARDDAPPSVDVKRKKTRRGRRGLNSLERRKQTKFVPKKMDRKFNFD